MRRDSPGVVELLQQLIRNRCVSEGFPSTGEEIRNAELLHHVVAGPGVEAAIVTPEDGRPSLVARVEGSDSAAPSLCLAAHTDVVGAEASEWARDPFGGELADGEIWGRGAVDMLGQAAAMAVTIRRLADAGFRPRGTLIFVAAPDEECGGLAGLKPLLEQYADLVQADYAVTEVGGAVRQTVRGPLVEGYVADKGGVVLRITVRGTSAHTMMPLRVDNALVKAAQVVQRIAAYHPATRIGEVWRAWVSHQEFDPAVAQLLTDPDRLNGALPGLPPDLARQAHASTHTVVVPTILHGADRINTIPGTVTVGVSVRTLPGDDHQVVVGELRRLLEDLVDPSDVAAAGAVLPTRSPTQTPLWRLLERIVAAHHPRGRLVPTLLTAQTDARYLRPAGTVTYGFALLSTGMTPQAYWSRFHGADERIDLESLDLAVAGYEEICDGFLH
jgi:acetylornithine deacetylase/succinyl-diaminopimelate desuccinylase-like protein